MFLNILFSKTFNLNNFGIAKKPAECFGYNVLICHILYNVDILTHCYNL